MKLYTNTNRIARLLGIEKRDSLAFTSVNSRTTYFALCKLAHELDPDSSLLYCEHDRIVRVATWHEYAPTMARLLGSRIIADNGWEM